MSQPMHDPLTSLGSSCSDDCLRCVKERYHRSILPAAVRLYNTVPSRPHTPRLEFTHVQYHCIMFNKLWNVCFTLFITSYCLFTYLYYIWLSFTDAFCNYTIPCCNTANFPVVGLMKDRLILSYFILALWTDPKLWGSKDARPSVHTSITMLMKTCKNAYRLKNVALQSKLIILKWVFFVLWVNLTGEKTDVTYIKETERKKTCCAIPCLYIRTYISR